MSRILFSIGALQVLIVLVSVGRSKVLSILLGPGGFGIMSTIDQVVLTLVSLGALSLPFTALKFMSRSHSQGSEAFQQTYLSFVRVLALLVSAAAMFATAALAWWPELFGPDLLAYRSALQLAVLGVPALALNILFVNTLAAAQRPAAGAGLNLLATLALALAAIVGVKLGGLPGLYVGTIAAGLITTMATLAYFRQSLGLRLSGPAQDLVHEFRRSPEIISYSGYIYLVMTAYSLTLLATRYYVLSRLGDVQAGFLQALLSIALTVGAVLAPLSNLYLAPLVNRQIPVRDKVRAAHNFARKMLILLLLAALPVILFPQLVLSILFTAEFAVAAKALFVFVLWQCLYQMVNISQQLLIGLDDVLFVSLAACAGFGSAALLFPVLIPHLGLGGAAGALALGMAIYGLAAEARLRLRFDSAAPAGLLVQAGYVLGAVSMAGWLFAGRAELTLPEMAQRTTFAIASLGLYWLLLGPEERDFVRTGFGVIPLRRRVRP